MLKRVKVWSAVCAGALLAILAAGCGTSGSSSGNITATPTLSPGGGTYNTSKTVTIADTDSGAVLYCTTDGTTPKTSSPKCAQPTTVFQTEFMQAIAVAPGKQPSVIASAAYTIDLSAAATPTFSPAGGSYTSPQQVTIADATSGANLFYTTDGSIPTASSTLYTAPVAVSSSETLNAIATASGYGNSGVASADYTISQSVAPPVFSVPTGNYSTPQTVTITDATPTATIYYVTDGSTPSASSTQYTGPITVSQTETISAIAILGGNSSPIVSAAYAITSAVPAPTFSPASGGTLNAGQTVTIADGDANATIYYTMDGSTPSASSSKYTGPVALSNTGSVTVQAIAVDSGSSSSVASATYTVSAAAVPAPTFSPASGGTVTVGQTVTIADSDANATIYYTTDGSAPSASSSKYTGPVALSNSGPVTVQAIAVDSGASSSVATATYTVSAAGQPLNGTVLSGTKPVNGGQVQLYAAGQSDYGSNATPIGAAVTTDSSGKFTVNNYSCPASPGDLVYLVASGGDAGSGANSKLELMTALGACGSLGSTSAIMINEVTTVASAYALAQFMTTAPNVGSSSGNYQGLSNAFAAVNNLVDITSGKALSMTPAYAAKPVPYLNSSTAPQARIDTLANMLNACADSNGSGGGCSNLFSATTPASGTAPANTLQAILNLAQNPGAKASALFALASPTGPFKPVLSSAPNDWTLALTFTGAGLGIAPNTTATYSGNTTPLAVINTALAVDATGNIWVTAYADNSPSSPSPYQAVATFVAGFNNQGAPLTPATTLDSANPPAVTLGGYNPEPGAGLAMGTIAIDQTGNLWLGDFSTEGNILEVGTSPSLSVLVSPQVTMNSIYSSAIDGSSNAWFGGNKLNEYQSNGTAILSNVTAVSPVDPSGPGILSFLAFDANGGLWGDDNSNDAQYGNLYQISTSDGSVLYAPYLSSSGSPTTMAADGSGNIYGCGDAGGQTLDVFNAAALVSTQSITTGRGCGSQLVLDGQGHLFAVLNSAGYPLGANIDEFKTDGTLISPGTNGFTGTGSGEPPTLNPDPNYFTAVPGIGAAIDGSGNLWVLNNDTNGATSPGNVLVEFVGLAAPVVTPTSAALTNGQLGVRP